MKNGELEEKDVNAIFNAMDELIEDARSAKGPDLHPLLRDRIILRLVYSAGLRISEILEIDADSWNEPLNHGEDNSTTATIDIRRSDRILKIKISDNMLIEMIKEYVRDVRPQFLMEAHAFETAMFLSQHGRPLTNSSIINRMKRVLERAGLGGQGVTLHKLRYAGIIARFANMDEEKAAYLCGDHGLQNIDRFLYFPPLDTPDTPDGD